MSILVSLPLHVACVIYACDDVVLDIHGEQMTSRMDLLLEGIIDRASMELEVVFFSFFSGV